MTPGLQKTEDELIVLLREFAAGMQASGSVTAAQRAAAGLPIRKTTRTATPYLVTYTPEDAGKSAHYSGRFLLPPFRFQALPRIIAPI